MRHLHRLAGSILPVLVLLAACESGTGSNDPPRFSIQGRAQTLNSVGDTMQLRLMGEGVNSAGAQWSSSNPQVASVSAGFVRTTGVGMATITAALDGGQATLQLEVRQVPARIRLTRGRAPGPPPANRSGVPE